MVVYYITRKGAGAIDEEFLYEHLSNEIVSSLAELTDDYKMLLLNEEQIAFYLKYADYIADDPIAVYDMIPPNIEAINDEIKKKRESTYIAETDKLYMAYVKYKEFGEDELAAEAYTKWKQAVLEVEESNPYITQ